MKYESNHDLHNAIVDHATQLTEHVKQNVTLDQHVVKNPEPYVNE